MGIVARIRRWWLCRQLHWECVMNQVMLDCYGPLAAPLGACTECEKRLAKFRAMRMPVATLLERTP